MKIEDVGVYWGINACEKEQRRNDEVGRWGRILQGRMKMWKGIRGEGRRYKMGKILRVEAGRRFNNEGKGGKDGIQWGTVN